MTRQVYVTYCDDVRLEVNNKVSLMGVYAEVMYLSAFPAHIPKLCAVVNATTEPDKPFKDFYIQAKLNNAVIGEMQVTEAELETQMGQAPGSALKSVQAQMIFSPVALKEPAVLTITFRSEGVSYECNSLELVAPPDGMVLVV
ncbi:DUF6941 family protein [Enterobacterales bacterium AE_CKDN230030158-1A_HGKHYDSX7]